MSGAMAVVLTSLTAISESPTVTSPTVSPTPPARTSTTLKPGDVAMEGNGDVMMVGKTYLGKILH